MKRRIFALVLVGALATLAEADLTFYGPTEKPAFEAGNTVAIVEDFESVAPKDAAVPSFVSNGITYTGLTGTPFANVWVASPGYTNFGVPITPSSVLTANGDEDFEIGLDLTGPFTAVGFDTYLNTSGPATVRVLNSDGWTATPFNHDSTTVGFFGVASTSPISKIRWTTVDGRSVNTGIDNVQVGLVPVPAAVYLGVLGLGVAGMKLRKFA